MGTYAGHVIPGSFFIIYGLWWLFVSYSQYFYFRGTRAGRNVTKRDNELRRRSWVTLPCLPRFHIEPACKIILPLLGIIIELLVDKDGEGNIIFSPATLGDVERLQHGTMYLAFIISGLVDLLSIVVRIPRVTGMLFLSAAFWLEGLLFYFHVGGREMLDVRIHLILVLGIFGCGVATLARMYSPTNLLINGSFTFAMLFQGTWFIQAAEVLYGNNAAAWNWSDHHHAMVVALFGAWHVLGLGMFMLLLWVVSSLLAKRCRGRKMDASFFKMCFKFGFPTKSGDEEVELNARLMEEEGGEETRSNITELQDL